MRMILKEDAEQKYWTVVKLIICSLSLGARQEKLGASGFQNKQTVPKQTFSGYVDGENEKYGLISDNNFFALSSTYIPYYLKLGFCPQNLCGSFFKGTIFNFHQT